MSVTELVSRFTSSTEDVTDELTHTAGSVTTKVAPLMATLASGLSVLFAIYDGLGRLLDGKVPEAYTISAVVGLIVMLGLEGASLAAVFNADRVRAINANRPADQKLNEDALPVWMLFLTMLIVFGLETAPVFASWVNGLVATSDLVFAFGLLALPLLGRAGAVIFSTSAMLDSIDGAGERRQKRKEQREQCSLDLEIKREEAKQRLAIQRAEAEQKLEIEREKADKKLGKMAGKNRENLHNLPDNEVKILPDDDSEILPVADKLKAARLAKKQDRLDRFNELIEEGSMSVRGIADELGVTEQTVDNYIRDARSSGRNISVNGVVKVL